MALSAFDDFCIHQGAGVIRKPATDSRNSYDRYFTNGFARDGSYYFAVSLGRYPNRDVMDAAITFQVGGVHYSFFASRRDPAEPTEMKLGAFELTIDQPMRSMSVTLMPNESGLSCDLRWLARSAPILETRSTTATDEHVTEDITRWTQFGCWVGWFEIDGRRIEVTPEKCPGVKDRSWGVRAWGLSESAVDAHSEPRPQQAFWNWIPLNFGDFAIHALRFEGAPGQSRLEEGFIAPMCTSEAAVEIQDNRISRIKKWTHDYEIAPDTRKIVGGSITLEHVGDAEKRSVVKIGHPILTAWPYAIGYNHPKWRHGLWQGELETGHERWNIADVDPVSAPFALMHQIVNVEYEGKKGIGFVEQSLLGPYPKYGLS